MTEQMTSYSGLNLYRSCPQKWAYAKIRGLSRIEDTAPPVERDFGSWWHMLRAAEALERGRAIGSLKKVPRVLRSTEDAGTVPGDTATAEAVLSQVEPWWGRQSEEYRSAWVSKLGLPAHEGLSKALMRWLLRWEDERRFERPLAVEMGWGRDLGDVRLVGYVDEVYEDTRRNVVVVRDNKTSKELATQTAVDDMMDSQLQLYVWGIEPEVEEWDVGRVGATSYDRMRSVAPHPPQLTLSGRLTERGGVPSVGQCDLATYLEWCAEPGVAYPGTKRDGSGAGRYLADPAVIERLSTPAAASVWFQRTLVPLNPNIIKAHLQAAKDTASDTARAVERFNRYGDAGRNLGASCRWCDFVALCRVELIGGSEGDYDLRELNLKKV